MTQWDTSMTKHSVIATLKKLVIPAREKLVIATRKKVVISAREKLVIATRKKVVISVIDLFVIPRLDRGISSPR